MSLCLWTANCTPCFLCRRPLNEVRSTHWPVSHMMKSVLPITASLQLCCYIHMIWSTLFESWSTWANLIAALCGFHQYFLTNTVGQHSCIHVRFCTWKHPDLICSVSYILKTFMGFFCSIVDTKPCPEIGHYRLYGHRSWFVIHHQTAIPPPPYNFNSWFRVRQEPNTVDKSTFRSISG